MTRARPALFAILALAPFEPRFSIALGPVGITALEAAAALGVLAIAASARDRRDARGAIRDPIVGALLAFCGAAFLSAALAGAAGVDGAKFALRFVAMTAFAVLVSLVPGEARRAGFAGLAFGGLVASFLAVAEAARVREADLVLGAFREQPFAVAGVRRATAGSEYPNLAAAMMAYATVAAAALCRDRALVRVALVATLSLGIAFTYSRGAAAAALAGLFLQALVDARPGRAERLAPTLAAAGVFATFAGAQEVARVRLSEGGEREFYAARYEVPRAVRLNPRQIAHVTVRVTNDGSRSWTRAERFNLSYHLRSDSGGDLVGGARTRLTSDVPPGGSLELLAELRAPGRPGRYDVLWDLVHEDTTWFSGQGVTPGWTALRVVESGDAESGVTDAAPRAALGARRADPGPGLTGELAWRPTRAELWNVAARMWAANPLLGVGPDQYRRTYGRWAGRDVFDTRVYANNLYLELAATLGTLGLAPFLAALVFSLRRAASRAGNDGGASAAFAVLAVFAIHGLVDYTLAFTGHYLVAGFAFGAAVATRERPAEPSGPPEV